MLENYILPTNESRTFSLGNFSLPGQGSTPGPELYNVRCELLNISAIRFSSEFNDQQESISVIANNVSGVCDGLYNYTLDVFGSVRTINDTWNLTIANASYALIFGVGL